MSERYTRRDAQAAMQRLAMALGQPYADHEGDVWSRELVSVTGGKRYEYRPTGRLWARVNGANVAYVGAWHLDYAAAYGGFVIAEVVNEGGGEARPLGDRRRGAREFCEAVRFALDAIRVLRDAPIVASMRQRA